MEIFLVIGFLVGCLIVALGLYVMATRAALPPEPPDSADIQPLDDVSSATRKAWEAIK